MKDTLEFIGLVLLVSIFSFQIFSQNTGYEAPRFGDEKSVELLIESAQSHLEESAREKGLIDYDDGDDEVECICDGSGVVRHLDGHTTPCPALEVGKCKSQTNGEKND